MSRAVAGIGAGVGAVAGGAMGFVAASLFSPQTRGIVDETTMGIWGAAGALLGAVVGASMGAGCATCPNTVVQQIPQQTPRFP